MWFTGGQRQRHHVEVGSRVLLQARHDHQRVAEHLVEPRPDFLGDGERLAPLDPGDHFQQVRAFDVVDRALAQQGQHILGEDAREDREGGLPALLEAEFAVGKPLLVDRLEGVFTGEFDRGALLLAVKARVDVLGHQGARLVTQGACLTKGHLGIGAQRHALGLLHPVVTEVPALAARGRHGQGETIDVWKCVGLAGGFGLADHQV